MRVAMTFDAEHPEGPCADAIGNARAIMRTLSEESVPATFFVQGKWAAAFPDLAREMRSGGHLVGSHSHSHCAFPRLTEEGIVSDLEEARAALHPLVGETRPWLRLPQCAGRDDPRVLQAVRSSGYQHVDRSVAHGDWRPGRRAEELASAILADVVAQSATAIPVVLMHTWTDSATGALLPVIHDLRSRGAEFVTVDEVGGLGR